jgi:hypothetical protein
MNHGDCDTAGVTRGRLPVLALVVAALVALVALVAHGRPLAASAGHGGLPSSFWDYVVTTGLIVFVLAWFLLLVMAPTAMPARLRKHPTVSLMLLTLLRIIVLGVVLIYVFRHFHLSWRHGHNPFKLRGEGRYGHGLNTRDGQDLAGHHLIWPEIAIVAGLLVLASAIVVAKRPRKQKPPWLRNDAVAAALDESLDDLRADPDLRRAIVAAYARMETALAVAGLARHPSEAPLEYVERALIELDLSGPSVRRLTDLFEWARFSHHEPEPTMRDEAVNALEAVRDGLRERAEAEVAA